MYKLLSSLLKKNSPVKMTEDCISSSYPKLKRAIYGKTGDEFEKAFTQYLKEIRFPPVQDFKPGLEWFNVSEPITFEKHLKGKLVLLDFFTYCCINCMHILPDLKEIEEEYPVHEGLVVIGVHSAKFENEKDSSNILSAVQRYNIIHPVVNDSGMDMWRKCDVHCWPTMLLLGPYANPIVMLTGEGHKNELKSYIKHALKYYKSQDLITDQKLPLKSSFHVSVEKKGPLTFPGKITNIVEDNEEFFAVSDSGNNRILLLDSDGQILKEIGSSLVGFEDGTLKNSKFNNPQGLAFKTKNLIYVADTDNHAVRLVDLSKNSVVTVAGTGVQGHDYKGGKIGKEQSISSPWDLVLYKTENGEEVLIIAMAGTHQIWALFLNETKWWKGVVHKAGTCVAIAGSGREENRNNQYPHTAGFAQPSGLALRKKSNDVYIADSESSSVRRLSLVDGKVTPVVGGDKNPHNLFAFGDKDGTLYEARLQHSLGVALSKDESALFVADTYNHKIKKVDVEKNAITSLNVSPINDTTDGKTSSVIFKEPAGLCYGLKNDKLYVCDTNNHRIKTCQLDPNTNKFSRVENLDVKPKNDVVVAETLDVEKPISIGSVEGEIVLSINLRFDDVGLKLTDDAPQKWKAVLPSGSDWSCEPASGNLVESKVRAVVRTSRNAVDRLTFVFDLMTCTESTCLPRSFAVRIPLVKVGKVDEKVENFINVDVKSDCLKVF